MARNDTGGFGSPPARLGPMDIQQKEFRVSRFGGYRMRDVDEFLDELTTSMGAVIAENDRLREQAGAAPIVGSPDLDDVGRQADEIIQRARDEAERILADARAGAAATHAIATGAGGRESVDAFLVQEREFLQGLAALVQNHAESVKSMARASRDAARRADEGSDEGADPDEATVVEAAGDDGPESAAADHASTAREAEEAAPETTHDAPSTSSEETDTAPSADATDTAASSGEETIHIDDPQPARAGGDGDADGSLRELFWGEED